MISSILPKDGLSKVDDKVANFQLYFNSEMNCYRIMDEEWLRSRTGFSNSSSVNGINFIISEKVIKMVERNMIHILCCVSYSTWFFLKCVICELFPTSEIQSLLANLCCSANGDYGLNFGKFIDFVDDTQMRLA